VTNPDTLILEIWQTIQQYPAEIAAAAFQALTGHEDSRVREATAAALWDAVIKIRESKKNG
jgi:hypothetical protein